MGLIFLKTDIMKLVKSTNLIVEYMSLTASPNRTLTQDFMVDVSSC